MNETDDQLFDELADIYVPEADPLADSERAPEAKATARANICISCEFYSDAVCVRGNFGVFRQAASEAGKCPEGKW